MEITVTISEEIEVALALLTEAERQLVLQNFITIGPYAISNDIRKLWEAELTTPECDIDRVKRLGAAYRMLNDDDDLEEARALLQRAER